MTDQPVAPNPYSYVPKMMFFTRGKGSHKDYLDQFWAGTSGCRDSRPQSCFCLEHTSAPLQDSEQAGRPRVPEIRPSHFCNYGKGSRPTSRTRLIASAVGLAKAADESQYGYLSEHHPYGETAQKAGDYAEDMAMEMLATTLGLPNDTSLAWNEKEEQWKLSNKIYKTQNFTQSAEGNKDGLWTTVISAAVLIL